MTEGEDSNPPIQKSENGESENGNAERLRAP